MDARRGDEFQNGNFGYPRGSFRIPRLGSSTSSGRRGGLVPECRERGYTPRRDEKSAEVIDRQRVERRPLCTPFHNGRLSTLCLSITSALFSSRRGVYPL